MSSTIDCSFSLRLDCGHNVTHRGRKPLVGDPWWCPHGHFSVNVSDIWQTTRNGGPLMVSSNQSPKRCPVCDNPVDAPSPETICNPHNCPSWEATHVYDRKTRTWVPEGAENGSDRA